MDTKTDELTPGIDEPVRLQASAAILMATGIGLFCAAAALLQLAAEGYDPHHPAPDGKLLAMLENDPRIDGDSTKLTPGALLAQAAGTFGTDDGDGFQGVVDQYRRQLNELAGERMEREVSTWLGDLPTTDEHDER